MTSDAVNPQHYRNAKGVQLIELIRWLPFSLGNAIKYCYRCEQKENMLQDLKKALWYLEDYHRYPSRVVDAGSKLSPQLVEEVLASTAAFERACCEALLRLDRSADSEAAYKQAYELISSRVEELQREQGASA